MCGRPGELKALEEVTPPGYRRLEVECEESRRALQQLRRRDGVADATLFGQSIHLLVDEAVGEALIQAELNEAGLGCREVRRVEPTLEDVFVMLTRRHAVAALAGAVR